MNSASGSSPTRHGVWNQTLHSLRVVWASPATLTGLAVGAIGLISGGGCQVRSGVVEFHGGAVTKLLERTPVGAAAMTFGHVVLGRNPAALDLTRTHERIHVRQYERWGPFFIPAYLAFSATLWCQGKDPYRENPFEVEAFEQS